MITDDQVFNALEAYINELKCWRTVNGPSDRYCLAVRDRGYTSYDPEVPTAAAVTIERHDFTSADKAKDYIRWRGIKAALEKAIGG